METIVYTKGYGIKKFDSFEEINRKSYEPHRNCKEGPAVITYGPDGQILIERYMENGLLHNEFGPAVIIYKDRFPNYKKDNLKIWKEYWLYNNFFVESEWKQLMIKKVIQML